MEVRVGPATIVGYLLTAIGAAATAWAAASHNPAISAEVLSIVTVAAGVFTNLGRQFQAGKKPAEVLTNVLESAVKPDA